MKKNEGDITRWLGLCKIGLEERKAKQPEWDKLQRYFRGIQWDKSGKDGYDIVVVNMVYSHVKVVLPVIYPKNPKIYFEANKAIAVDTAKLNEAIFNRDMVKMKLKQTNKRILQDVTILGTGFSKTTFEIEGYSSSSIDSDKVVAMKNEFKDLPAAAVEGGMDIPPSYPRCVRVSPFDLVTALGTTDFEDPGFIGHHVRKRLISIKNDDFFVNTKDLQPTSLASTDMLAVLPQGQSVGSDDEMLAMVDLWEIWDVENQQWFVIAEGHGDYLVEPRDNIFPYAHPFDRMVFTELDDQIWGMSDIEPWLPQQDELNLIRTQQINHIKRYNRKYIVRKLQLENSDEGITQLQNGEDGVILFAQGERPLDDIVKPIADAPMPADIYRISVGTEDDIVKIGGLTPYRRGGTVGANTATEANIAEGNSQIRDQERVDQTADFVLSQMEKVRNCRKEFTTSAEIIDVTGNPLDQNRWQEWTRDSIDIESEMRVEFGPDRPLNQEERLKRALLLYDRAMANPTVNPQAAFVNLLEAADERDYTKWFLPNVLVQLQILMKALQGQKEQKGASPMGGSQPNSGAGVGPQPAETDAELQGAAVA